MKKYLIVISILIVIFISACSTSKSVDDIQTSKIDTSTWKTYVSELQGYEISFPRDYKCPEGQFAPCLDKNDRVKYEHVRLSSEDLVYDSEVPQTFSFEIESLKQKPSDRDLFKHINSQINLPVNQRPDIKVVKVHDAKMLNGHNMVKVETIQEGQDVDIYFIEKSPTTYLRIFVGKLKPEEAKKRTDEIDAIISSFRFIS